MCERQLFNCYWNSLEVAKEHDVHSIAFPAISTGAYGYPKQEAAVIALSGYVRKDTQAWQLGFCGWNCQLDME